MNHVYLMPSLYAHVINGILLLIAVIVAIMNYSSLKKIGAYKSIVLLLLFSLVIGIHGLTHLGMESVYNYNPLAIFL
jgi:hypothetical protein